MGPRQHVKHQGNKGQRQHCGNLEQAQIALIHREALRFAFGVAVIRRFLCVVTRFANGCDQIGRGDCSGLIFDMRFFSGEIHCCVYVGQAVQYFFDTCCTSSAGHAADRQINRSCFGSCECR